MKEKGFEAGPKWLHGKSQKAYVGISLLIKDEEDVESHRKITTQHLTTGPKKS